MKKSIILGLVLFASFAQAQEDDQQRTLLLCKATKVLDSSVLEESLSVEEYPDIRILDNTASLGASQHTEVDTSLRKSKGKVKVSIVEASGEESYEISYNLKTKQGSLIHKTTNEEETSVLAELDCSEDLALYDASDAAASLVSDAKEQKEIYKGLNQVDIAFEMGDGYFDVQSSELYKLVKNGSVIGYIEKAVLSYTEDPELYTVQVRYDIYGNRYQDIETISVDDIE